MKIYDREPNKWMQLPRFLQELIDILQIVFRIRKVFEIGLFESKK